MPNDPQKLDATFARALEMQGEGRIREALAAFEECTAIAPANARAHAHAGLASMRLDDWGKGIAHFRVAIAAAPQVAEGWMHLASALERVGRLDDAERVARQAVSLQPALAGAWNTLGLIKLDRGRYEEGREHLLRALGIEPRFALALMNLGCCEHGLGRDDDAFASLRRALDLDPTLASAHYNLGALHHKRGQHADAMRHYREAIALRPGDAQSHFNLAHASFITGRIEEGWREHAWRSQRREHEAAVQRRGTVYALPAPAELAQARLAILAEQGLGDILFFLRFAPGLRPRVATMEFVGDERLHGMLGRTGLFDDFARRAEDLGEGERHEVLAGDLPLIEPDAMATTPPPLELSADPARLAAVRLRLAALGPAPYVALAWRSGEPRSGRIENLFKEIAPAALGEALRGVGATWIAIQRDPRPGEIEALAQAIGAPVHDLSGVNTDLEDALALVAAVGEYVGVSSTLVHLLAGVGASSRIVVPFPYEWRWMESGGTSPWFPRATIYRQGADRDWGAALSQLSRDLREDGITSR